MPFEVIAQNTMKVMINQISFSVAYISSCYANTFFFFFLKQKDDYKKT